LTDAPPMVSTAKLPVNCRSPTWQSSALTASVRDTRPARRRHPVPGAQREDDVPRGWWAGNGSGPPPPTSPGGDVRTTETRRIGRWLGVAVAVVVAVFALGDGAPASAAPTAAGKIAAAGDGSDCYAVADAPWHSTVTNRVYFSGHVSCPQSFPSLINMYTLRY